MELWTLSLPDIKTGAVRIYTYTAKYMSRKTGAVYTHILPNICQARTPQLTNHMNLESRAVYTGVQLNTSRTPQFTKYAYMENRGCIYSVYTVYIQGCIHRGKIQVSHSQ